MITKYDIFLEENLLSRIDESIIYYSPELEKVLTKIIDSEIAYKMLSVIGQDLDPDTTFLDLDKDGYLSFITWDNALKYITNFFGEDNHVTDRFKNKDFKKSIWDIVWKGDHEVKKRNKERGFKEDSQG